MSRVVLAMSGGVDSSVAAHLLLAAGHEVIGLFMRHGQQPVPAVASCAGSGSSPLPLARDFGAGKQGCCSVADAEDARRVADVLGIAFYALNFDDQFTQIIDYFVDEYTVGRTPNPCIMCNNWLKFGKLFDYADSVDAEFVATGHYARLVADPHGDGTPALYRGLDPDKDQSYVLFGVERHRLGRMLLPVGEYRKARIRALAAEIDLPVADKRDSQEICFVAAGRHGELVASRRGDDDASGQVVTTDGRVVGTHAGVEHFTIGQRKGLGGAMGEPYFVIRIDAPSRQVVIGKREALARHRLTADRVSWLAPQPTGSRRCLAAIRYNSPAAEATVRPLPDGRIEVLFDEPRYGVAPGQAVVCYDGDRVLGGGWIL